MKPLTRELKLSDVEHLLRRIAYAPRLGEARSLVKSRVSAADLVDKALGSSASKPNSTASEVLSSVRRLNDRDLLAGAWLLRIQDSQTPLRDSLSLFWHNHFVSSLSKVRESAMLQDQIEVFYRYGDGDFATLCHHVSQSAAMIRYLDLERSTKSAPNENFARELLELFTTGKGPYTERDIKEAARAFAGYHLRGSRFHFSTASSDKGTKTVLGQTGTWTGKDVVNICARHAATARFVGTKLARHFVCDAPDASLIEAITASFIRHKGAVGVVLKELFTSELFYAPRYRFQLTKSPVRLIMSALKIVGRGLTPAQLARSVQSMGQNLCDAPSVEGYAGGKNWLNPATHLARREFLLELAAKSDGLATASGDVVVDAELPDLIHVMLGKKPTPSVRTLVEQAHKEDPQVAKILLLCHPDFQRA